MNAFTNRNKIISFAISERDLERLYDQAARYSLTLSDYMRRQLGVSLADASEKGSGRKGRPMGSATRRYVFDKDIPLPPVGHSHERHGFSQMEIGDSIWFDNRAYGDINVMVWKAQKRLGFVLKRRKLPGGVRVWRVK